VKILNVLFVCKFVQLIPVATWLSSTLDNFSL
jgi:hypothetical protein